MNDLHHFHDFIKSLLAFDLLLNILDFFQMLIEPKTLKREWCIFGNVIVERTDIASNLVSLKFVKACFFFFGQIFALFDKLVNTLCNLRPFEKHTRFSVLQSTV